MHNLDITNGIASFVTSNREDAWHRLGQTVDKPDLTALEVLTEAHLANWNVRKLPMTATDPDTGLVIPATGRAAVVRTNPITGQPQFISDMSARYGIIQNEDHVATLDALIDESGAFFQTAGALYDDGRQVFVTMRLPGDVKVGGVDRVDHYIAAVNSHDGSMPFSIMVTPVRIVCANTLNFALGNHLRMFKVRHTSNALKGAVGAAREALDLTFDYVQAFQDEAEALINETMTQKQFEELIVANYGAPEDAPKAVQTRADERIGEMTHLFADAQTQEGIRDTKWAAVNALAEWWDHFAPVKGDDPDAQRARKALLDTSFKDRAMALVKAA